MSYLPVVALMAAFVGVGALVRGAQTAGKETDPMGYRLLALLLSAPLAALAGRAIFFVARHKQGISALQLQRDTGLGSYQSAWTLLHKLRSGLAAHPVEGSGGGG